MTRPAPVGRTRFPTPARLTLAPEGDPMPTGGRRLADLDPALNAPGVIDGTAVRAYR
jgi:hypothetical protein